MGYSTAKIEMVSDCKCGCVERVARYRGARPKVAKVAKLVPANDRAPYGLSKVRKAVIDYFSDPKKHLDFTRGKETSDFYDRERGEYIPAMTFPVLDFASATGMKKLGSGNFSDVYVIDDKRVLKIIKQSDTGYARWADAAKRHASNPHFPKIFYSGTWGGKTVYILERLSENPEDGNHDTSEHFRSAVRRGENPFMTFATKHIAEIAKVMDTEDHGGDLHRANLMFRGNIPVVTDPSAD